MNVRAVGLMQSSGMSETEQTTGHDHKKLTEKRQSDIDKSSFVIPKTFLIAIDRIRNQ